MEPTASRLVRMEQDKTLKYKSRNRDRRDRNQRDKGKSDETAKPRRIEDTFTESGVNSPRHVQGSLRGR